MSYYARFDIHSGATFRSDTRIYLNENPVYHTDGKCVAAIVGKNPGSASSTKRGVWESLNLSGDKMLPSVKNRFIKAYELAGKTVEKNAFVQVWNLFYLCDKILGSALNALGKIRSPLICLSENNIPKIVWFAWGGDDPRLNPFKKRFLNMHPARAFFFDRQNQRMCPSCPTTANFAKHPQGLLAQPVIEHLANIL